MSVIVLLRKTSVPTRITTTISKKKLDDKQNELDDVNRQIAALEKIVKPEPVMPEPDYGNGSGGGKAGSTFSSATGTGNDNSNKDRFEAEDNWKKQEDAINRIAYAKGEKDYIAYKERMMEIEELYQQKRLELPKKKILYPKTKKKSHQDDKRGAFMI